MKKTLIPITLISILTMSCGLNLNAEKKQSNYTIPAESKVDSIPLLLMGSFLNLKENYSLDTVKIGLTEGWISCIRLVGIPKKILSLSVKPKEIPISSFNVQDEKSLILTVIDSVEARFNCKSINNIQFFRNPKAYPLWQESNESNADISKEITHYIHTGVTALTRSAGVVLDQQGIDWYLENILPDFTDASIVHINNEVSMLDTCIYQNMKMKFATRTQHMEILKKLNANVIELTGNHNLDVGQKAYLKTLSWYKSNNMSYFGGGINNEESGRPLIKTLKNGTKVAWIGFNEICPLGECSDINKTGARKYDESRARYIIDSLKKNAGVNYVLACVQFREIDAYSPVPTQKQICKNLINMGADVVLGSQAHQAQEIAIYKGKPIFYGLGNFLFDQVHRIGVRQAFYLHGYFYKNKIIQFIPVYTFMKPNRQPNIASTEEKRMIQTCILKKDNFETQP